MKTQTKAIVACAVIAASVIAANAQNGPQEDRPSRKSKEFKCPVCGSPCINKAETARQLKIQKARIHQARKFRANQMQQAQRPRNGPRRQGRQANVKHPNQRQRELRFDLNQDGQLSKAERAARRAFVQAQRQENRGGPNHRPAPRPPVGE